MDSAVGEGRMGEILEHILARRSIRRYTAEPVSEEDVTHLLQAAMAAPSASNRRPWEFVVVTEEEVLAALRRGLLFGRYRAPLAIAVCGNLHRAYPGFAKEFWIQDCSAATENLLLAASGLGLGAVWIGVYPIAPFVRHVRQVLHLPEHVIPLNIVYVGHPAESKEPRTQYEDTRVFWQRYGASKAEQKRMAPRGREAQ
jgi:nitroreductase